MTRIPWRRLNSGLSFIQNTSWIYSLILQTVPNRRNAFWQSGDTVPNMLSATAPKLRTVGDDTDSWRKTGRREYRPHRIGIRNGVVMLKAQSTKKLHGNLSNGGFLPRRRPIMATSWKCCSEKASRYNPCQHRGDGKADVGKRIWNFCSNSGVRHQNRRRCWAAAIIRPAGLITHSAMWCCPEEITVRR